MSNMFFFGWGGVSISDSAKSYFAQDLTEDLLSNLVPSNSSEHSLSANAQIGVCPLSLIPAPLLRSSLLYMKLPLVFIVLSRIYTCPIIRLPASAGFCCSVSFCRNPAINSERWHLILFWDTFTFLQCPFRRLSCPCILD